MKFIETFEAYIFELSHHVQFKSFKILGTVINYKSVFV